jgi:hypothetical protein
MENHKLAITRNNFDKIKTGMRDKFITVEEYVRKNRESIKVQFCLPEDLFPKIEMSKKKEISIEFRSKVKSIYIDLNGATKRPSDKNIINIEKPKKEIQIVKKEEGKPMEIITREPVKKTNEEEEKISNFIKSISKTEDELNVVILPSKKNLSDNEVVKISLIEVDDASKIKMITREDCRDYSAVFEDDPILTFPKKENIEKEKETEEELFEEKNCHEEAMGAEEDIQMLGGDFSLKANLKNHQRIFNCNVEMMLNNRKIIVDAEERRFEKRITKSG